MGLIVADSGLIAILKLTEPTLVDLLVCPASGTFSDEFFEYLLTCKLPELQVLTLETRSPTFTEEMLCSFASSTHVAPNLCSFKIAGDQLRGISPRGTLTATDRSLISFLVHRPRVTNLHLIWGHVSFSDPFFNSFESDSLTILAFQGSLVTNEGAKRILKCFPNLKELALGFSRATEQFLEFIRDNPKSAEKLEVLNMYHLQQLPALESELALASPLLEVIFHEAVN